MTWNRVKIMQDPWNVSTASCWWDKKFCMIVITIKNDNQDWIRWCNYWLDVIDMEYIQHDQTKTEWKKQLNLIKSNQHHIYIQVTRIFHAFFDVFACFLLLMMWCFLLFVIVSKGNGKKQNITHIEHLRGPCEFDGLNWRLYIA